jgi:hypothetical protein
VYAESRVSVPFKVRIVRVTRNPDGRWVAQQARNLAIEGRLDNVGFLIRDL